MHSNNRKWIKGPWLLAAVLLAVMAAFTPVFADGEETVEAPAAEETAQVTQAEEEPLEAPADTAPEEETPVDGSAAEETSAPTADAPETEEAPADAAPAEETPVDETAAEETSAPTADAPETEEAPTGTESIAQALAEAELVLADGNGEAVDMASAESAEVIAVGDPWWKVGTTLYATVRTGAACPAGTTLGFTCWESDEPITEALNQIHTSGQLPTDRKIYVEADALNYVETVNIDATTYPILAQLKGLIGSGSGGTVIEGNVYLDSLTGGFTLSGFTIEGMVGVWNSTGTLILEDLDVTSPDNSGIYIVNHFGNVEVREVRSNNNDSHGAEINTTNGIVKIVNSSFDDNGNDVNTWPEYGLVVSTNKAITLEGVSASRNMGNGIGLNSFSALTIKNTIANNNEDPNYNTAYYGYGTGEYNLNGYGIQADSWGMAAPVTLENVHANYNGLKGIDITTMGNVKANYVEAQYNTIRKGSILYEEVVESETPTKNYLVEYLSDDVSYDEWRFTLDDAATVNLFLLSDHFAPKMCLWDGATETCADNGPEGTYADLTDSLAAGTYYIRVYSYTGDEKGRYTLDAGWTGEENEQIYLYEGGMGFVDVFGKGTTRIENAYFYQNAGDGLYINSNNTIYLSSIVSTDNGEDGIEIIKTKELKDGDTLTGYGAAGTVTITSPKTNGSLTANNVSNNGEYGVHIASKGNILVANIDVVGNGVHGMYLDTCLKDDNSGLCLGAGGVTVNTTLPNWYNAISGNGNNGLYVQSMGNTKIDKVIADNNSYTGMYLDSQGTINLSNVFASQNGSFGAYLTTLNAPAARTVTMVDSNFDNNNNTGLKVLTAGAINVQGSSASGNVSPEEYVLDTATARIFDQLYDGQTVDKYWFYANQNDVMDAVLKSGDFDAFLRIKNASGVEKAIDDDSWGGTDAHISDCVLDTAGWYVIEVTYAGAADFGAYELALNGVNGTNLLYPGSGMDLKNSGGTAGVTIKPTKNNPYTYADDNANKGIQIDTNGAVSVSGMSANRNYRTGMSAVTPKAISVQDTSKTPLSTFDDNGWEGLYLVSAGTIKLNGVSASGNGFDGAFLDSRSGTGSITISNLKNYTAYFDNNSNNGLFVRSGGAITLTNVSASGNWVYGADLGNQTSPSAGVTVKASGAVTNDFSGNGGEGLMTNSHGAISINAISANYNDGIGIYLDNSHASAAKTVSLSNAAANNNGWSGTEVYSLGNITLMNAETSDNGNSGTYLNNQYTGYAGNVTIKYSKGSTNIFSRNNGRGLEIVSNGAVTMGNLLVSENYKTSDVLAYAFSETSLVSVLEFFNEEAGPDRWDFHAYAGNYHFLLNAVPDMNLDPFGFDPFLSLYSEDGTLLAQNDDNGPSLNSYFDYYIASEGWYYLEVGSAPDDMDGFYKLAINDMAFSNMERIFNNGAVVTAGKNVVVNGSQRNEFSNNSVAGLEIITPGNVTAQWILSYGNGTAGIKLWDEEGGTGNLIIQGLNATSLSIISGNGWDGVNALVAGKTTINNLWAISNGLDGLHIGDEGEPTGNNVTLNNVNANENTQFGVSIYSNGAVSASKVSAQNNGGLGMYVYNFSGSGTVTINGDSFISHNGWNDSLDDWKRGGLYIFSGNHITINKVFAVGNHYSGITAQSAYGNVTLNSVSSAHNGYHGIDIQGDYAIKLTKVSALSNGLDWMGFPQDGDGLHVHSPSFSATITLKSSTFAGNLGNGIDVEWFNSLIWYPDVYWFGNDTGGIADDPNRYLH